MRKKNFKAIFKRKFKRIFLKKITQIQNNFAPR